MICCENNGWLVERTIVDTGCKDVPSSLIYVPHVLAAGPFGNRLLIALDSIPARDHVWKLKLCSTCTTLDASVSTYPFTTSETLDSAFFLHIICPVPFSLFPCVPVYRSLGVEKIYNKVARTLVAFEYLWYQAWVQSIEQAKAGLQVRRTHSSGDIFGELGMMCQPRVTFWYRPWCARLIARHP